MKIIPLPPSTSIATRSATATSTTMALGNRNPPTAMFGFRTTFRRTGLLIATATGPTSGLGAGLGLTTLLGVLLLSTTVAGIISAATGVGPRARFMRIHIMGLPMWAGLGPALVSVSALDLVGVPVSVGSRSAGANRSIPGTTAATATGTT